MESTDKIARLVSVDCLQANPSHEALEEGGSAEALDEGPRMLASVRQLRQELEAKERMINELQQRLKVRSARPSHHRKSRSLIARSASIISSKTWRIDGY